MKDHNMQHSEVLAKLEELYNTDPQDNMIWKMVPEKLRRDDEEFANIILNTIIEANYLPKDITFNTEEILEALDELTSRERYIIELIYRYAFPIKAVARLHGNTTERMHNYRRSAIKKIAHSKSPKINELDEVKEQLRLAKETIANLEKIIIDLRSSK